MPKRPLKRRKTAHLCLFIRTHANCALIRGWCRQLSRGLRVHMALAHACDEAPMKSPSATAFHEWRSTYTNSSRSEIVVNALQFWLAFAQSLWAAEIAASSGCQRALRRVRSAGFLVDIHRIIFFGPSLVDCIQRRKHGGRSGLRRPVSVQLDHSFSPNTTDF